MPVIRRMLPDFFGPFMLQPDFLTRFPNRGIRFHGNLPLIRRNQTGTMPITKERSAASRHAD